VADEDREFRVAGGASFGTAEILAAASRAKADAFIDKQNELADLQIEDLRRENAIRHWSLRVRHVSDVLKLALELAAAFIVVALAVGLGVVIWQATHADCLVIETINVPAAMAEKGLSGPVIAAKLLDRLNAMQADTDSLRPASSFSNDWTNDIKVEIPDTGISLGQIVRYLDGALGHQTHLSGEVYEAGGGLALTIRLDDAPGQTFRGRNIDALVERATEAAYRQAQPYRYAVYLEDHDRLAEATAILRTLAKSSSPLDRGWANEALAINAAQEGRFAAARARVVHVLENIPDLPNGPGFLTSLDLMLGHDEDALREAARAVSAGEGSGKRDLNPAAAIAYPLLMRADIAEEKGDFTEAVAQLRSGEASLNGDPWPPKMAINLARAHDLAAATSELQDKRHVAADPSPIPDPAANTFQALAAIALVKEDWKSAIENLAAEIAEANATAAKDHEDAKALVLRRIDPLLAWAYAASGDRAKADAILLRLPADCYLCARMRGRVRAIEHEWGAAAYWFAQAAMQAPSPPFAHADWGWMLLAKGDLDGAISKFTIANQKGPHFADPLEMWGEALITKNRSGLAVAKFAEANKYAPNWGRLHLKWGEALLWSGKRDDAAKQFAIAAPLELTPSERAELAKVSHG